MGIECKLDLVQDANYKIIIKKDRALNQVFECLFYSGDTLYPFDFSPYTAATLQVRKTYDSSVVILEFNTTNGSIVLGLDGKFSLIKTAEELSKVRASNYVYDMYLSSSTVQKRGFLMDEFIIIDRVSI